MNFVGKFDAKLHIDGSGVHPAVHHHVDSISTHAPSDAIIVADADLLIADGQYTDAEYPSKQGWGHARAKTALDLAVQARVKKLAIFHHDPMHGDEAVDTIVRECQERAQGFGSAVSVFGAREGLSIDL